MAVPTATSVPTASGLAATPRLEIPKIGVSAGIVEVSWRAVETNDGVVAEWEVAPPDQVGRHADSAPLGEPGNTVLAAHGRDGAAFARLSELAAGDEVRLVLEEGRALRYRVSETVLLPELAASLDQRLDHARYLAPTDDARLTLVTCWPPWAYTHRLIVIAAPGGP
jgi:LPXTG-site transpeptidase (sortase) family protein